MVNTNVWTNRTFFEDVCDYDSLDDSDLYAYYTIPTIASAGPDRKLGVGYSNMNPGIQTYPDDNIYSFQLK